MTNSVVTAELVKLSRDLATEPAALDFLKDQSPQALRDFRRAVRSTLDAPHQPMFKRLARAGALVPSQLLATIATRFFGPEFCARIAPEFGAEKSVKFLGHVSTPFVADIAAHLDPDAVGPLVAGLGTKVIVDVTEELRARGDLITSARLVGALNDAQFATAVRLFVDPDEILDIANFVESDATLRRVVDGASDEQVRACAAAARERGEFDALLERVSAATPAGGERLRATAA